MFEVTEVIPFPRFICLRGENFLQSHPLHPTGPDPYKRCGKCAQETTVCHVSVLPSPTSTSLSRPWHRELPWLKWKRQNIIRDIGKAILRKQDGFISLTLIQHPPLHGAELEGQLIAAVPRGFSINTATSVWAVLSAQACPLLIPAHLCWPKESVTPCPSCYQQGKAIFSSVKKIQTSLQQLLCVD